MLSIEFVKPLPSIDTKLRGEPALNAWMFTSTVDCGSGDPYPVSRSFSPEKG